MTSQTKPLKRRLNPSKAKTPNGVVSSRLVQLRRITKKSLSRWKTEMAKAARELRSTDEGYARDAVVWLNGYLMALDDVEGSRVVTHGAEKLNDSSAPTT